MDGNRAEKVAAVVVTYNRKDLLKQCLEGILAQTRPVDAIYVIDNASCDGTDRMITEEYSGRVNYVRLPENTGGAGGFHHGMKLAYEAGYDWIWVMDDDSIPAADCLENLVRLAPPDAGWVCPAIYGPQGDPQLSHPKKLARWPFVRRARKQAPWALDGLTRIDAASFVGLLVRRAAIAVAGLPDPAFWIEGDDSDFTFRVARVFPCYVLWRARVMHAPSLPPRTSSALNDWKVFYMKRNAILFARKHDGMILAVLLASVHVIKSLVGALRPHARPLRRYLRLRLGGVWSGLRARPGKLERPPAWLLSAQE